MAKSGNMNQMIYRDPKPDFAAIALSHCPYHSGFCETKAPRLHASGTEGLGRGMTPSKQDRSNKPRHHKAPRA